MLGNLQNAQAEIAKLPVSQQRLLAGESKVAETREEFLKAVCGIDKSKLQESTRRSGLQCGKGPL